MKKVSTYHSRRPHLVACQIRPDRRICPRSTAKTPSWQVTLDSSSTVVLMAPSVRSRCAPGHLRPSLLSTERMVKYIANRAAKNISSEDSQMMVPTLTRLGLLAGERGVISADAVATEPIITTLRRGSPRDPPSKSALRPCRYRAVCSMACHEGRCVQPRRRRAGPDQARHRLSPRHGRAGSHCNRG